MVTTDFIVAIELGSSKMTGMAGRKLADGRIEILAVASEKSSDFIRKGVIYNLDKTSQSLLSIIKRLEVKLKATIAKVYVGVSGQSVMTTCNTEVHHLEQETKISQAFVDSIMDSNRGVAIVDKEILEVAPQEYKVGINFIADPVGVVTDDIEGRFLNIIANKSLKQKIDKCFQQANIEIADYITSPLALADATLTSSEKRSGCALIDFGADTTTVSIYKNNILRHLAVIPLGGSNITKDICSQRIEEEDAEELKKKYGIAICTEETEDTNEEDFTLEDKCTINAGLLENIIQARQNEILANVANQISLSRYEDKLLAGAIITGGAANLKNLEEAFVNVTKIDKVRFAKNDQYSVKDNSGYRTDLNNSVSISLLLAGKDNCCKNETLKVNHPSVASDLFTDDDAPVQTKKKEPVHNEIDEMKKIEEEEKKRFTDCTNLISKASSLKDQKEYKKALNALEQALKLGVIEKNGQIKKLESEIKELKESNTWINKFGKKFGNFTDKILSDDK